LKEGFIGIRMTTKCLLNSNSRVSFQPLLCLQCKHLALKLLEPPPLVLSIYSTVQCTVQLTEHTGRELSSPLGMIYGCPYSQLRMLFFKFKYLELRSIISLHLKGYLVQGITKGEPGLESFIYSFSLNLKYENK